jgi:uncharacterized damage-inducible protein DinB
MQPFFVAYFNRLEGLHDDITQAIDGLPREALDWVPGPDINSLAVLVAHVVGSQRYWIGDVVAGDPSNRDRDAEFRTQGVDAATLKKRLADTLAHSRAVLESLALEDLTEARVSARVDHKITVGWALAHALEHTAIHVGHIQIVRQWWEQQGQG